MKKLEHPNIMRFFEHYVSGYKDKIYIVTEYLAGGALIDSLLSETRNSYTEADARIVIAALLSGLAYLHAQGVVRLPAATGIGCWPGRPDRRLSQVHRDLKLENLLLAKRDDLSSLRIADFGLAKAVFQKIKPAGEQEGMMVGPLLYPPLFQTCICRV